MKKIAILFFIAILALSACKPKELSQQDKTLIANLNTELNLVKEDLVKVLADIDEYEGGLIKDLLVYRSQILKTNEALIQQRIHAIESGTPITIEIKAISSNQKRIDEIQKEIDQIKENIKQTQLEADGYSGGMIKLTLLANVAAQKTSLSMLESERLAEKFDIQIPFSSREINDIPKVVNTNSIDTEVKEMKPAKPKLEPKDGPFGLQMGMSVNEIEELSESKLVEIPDVMNSYVLRKPPKPNSNFSTIHLEISKNAGLCSITAIYEDLKTDRNGINLQSEFNQIKDILISNYGEPTEKVDELLPGALYSEYNEWMDALNARERRFLVKWQSGINNTLKNNLQLIGLVAHAESSSRGALTLHYLFTNSDTCEAESLKMQKDGL